MEKQSLKCQSCAILLTKYDAQFVGEETFGFLKVPPSEIVPGPYCFQCFGSKVSPELERYEAKMEQARNVNVFYASQSKESRFIRRTEKPIQVVDCEDRDEVILRLAFMAAELGLNAILDVDLSTVKVRNGGWHTSLWSGRAIPARVDEAKLARKFPSTPN